MSSLENMDKKDLKEIEEAGIVLEEERNTYFFVNNGEQEYKSKGTPQEDFIFSPIKEALEKYPFIKEKYWGKLIPADQDEITKEVEADLEGGYFIWLKKDHKEVLPLQACFYIKDSFHKQKVHNLIILEEGAELHVINGCVSSDKTDQAEHLGVTEIFVGKNAFLSYTMVHNWNESTQVRPKSAMKVEEGAKFISNYIALKATQLVKSYPTAYVGKNASVSLNSVIFSHKGSVYDVGGRAVLEAEGAKADILSRSVSAGGEIIARAHLNSLVDDTFGHVECSSLMLNEEGHVHAIPELESNSKNVTLSHEALIGKIADDEVHYLMSRGISEEQAIALIVRGFLNIEIKGLPEVINAQIQETLKLLESEHAL